jgi:hypothetical protein
MEISSIDEELERVVVPGIGPMMIIVEMLSDHDDASIDHPDSTYTESDTWDIDSWERSIDDHPWEASDEEYVYERIHDRWDRIADHSEWHKIIPEPTWGACIWVERSVFPSDLHTPIDPSESLPIKTRPSLRCLGIRMSIMCIDDTMSILQDGKCHIMILSEGRPTESPMCDEDRFSPGSYGTRDDHDGVQMIEEESLGIQDALVLDLLDPRDQIDSIADMDDPRYRSYGLIGESPHQCWYGLSIEECICIHDDDDLSIRETDTMIDSTSLAMIRLSVDRYISHIGVVCLTDIVGQISRSIVYDDDLIRAIVREEDALDRPEDHARLIVCGDDHTDSHLSLDRWCMSRYLVDPPEESETDYIPDQSDRSSTKKDPHDTGEYHIRSQWEEW